MTIQEEKKEFRRQLRLAEGEMSAAERVQAGEKICRALAALPQYREAKTVFCFVGVGREINTRPFLEQVLADGKCLCVPLCLRMGVMEPRALTSLSQLVPGAYHIPEPGPETLPVPEGEIDFAVIPCLSCSHDGRRMGKGGGFYDRFLERNAPAAVMVCPESLTRENIPLEPHDRLVPLVLTEKALYRNGRPETL